MADEKNRAYYLTAFTEHPEEFMHVLTHDLREVLAGVNGAAFLLDMLREDVAAALDEEGLRDLDEALTIINDMVARGLLILDAVVEYNEQQGDGA